VYETRVNTGAEAIRQYSDIFSDENSSFCVPKGTQGRAFNLKVSALDQVCCVTSMSLSLTTNKELVFA
jgi:hypothetical protein